MNKLFKNPPQPVQRHLDSKLGQMLFSGNDDTWIGQYNGFEYHISYHQTESPQPELLQYCLDTLKNKVNLKKNLRQQKNQLKPLFGARFEQEIEALQYLNLMFYRHENELRVLAQLGDDGCDEGNTNDEDLRLWRIEFYGVKCMGMGFDT